MHRRICHVVLCVVILGVGLGAGRIRAAEPDQNTPDPYRQKVADFEARWEKVEAELRRLSAAVAVQRSTEAESPASGAKDVDDRLVQVEQTLEGMWAVIHEMRKTNDDLATRIKSIDKRRLIETTDRGSGRQPSQPKPAPMQGRLIVQNWTGQSHRMVINGQSYWVSPGRTVLTVPHAIVEAYLPAHEGPKLWGLSNWKLNGQCYEMFITLGST